MVDVAKESTPAGELRCIVVTPEQTVLDKTADFVAMPLFDGEIGIAPLHSPMIGRLGYGELRIRTEGKVTRYYVDGGFVQVLDNVVSVLTNRAVPAEKLEAEEAGKLLQTAMARAAAGEEEIAIRNKLVTQARAQLRIARNKI